MTIHVLDLEFQRPGTIAAYLVESAGELALLETGPDSTFPHLVRALARHGARPSDVKKVLVTHIHLDHAGAAWRMAREGATVYLHARGAGHMGDPSKLLASARRIYKDEMDTLWGTLEPIPADRMHVTTDGEEIPLGRTSIRVVETPGHAYHHNAYLVEGCLVTGDVGGVAIAGGPVLPPTPPPDIDIPVWERSIEKMRALRPEALYPTHFGRVENPDAALDELRSELHAWAGFIRAGLNAGKDEAALVPEFGAWLEQRLTAAGVSKESLEAYRTALPFAMNVTGLVRYWQKTAAA